MFRDPEEEKQGAAGVFSKNNLFIAAALLLALIAAAELLLLFRLPAAKGASPQPVAGTASAAATVPGEAPEAAAGRFPQDGLSRNGFSGSDWILILVNETHPLPAAYEVRLETLINGLQLDERAAGPLDRMIAAAKAEGLYPVVASAYRSREKQAELYNNKVARLIAAGMAPGEAALAAGREVAYPGTSEHNSGLAVDLVAYSYQQLDDAQGETAEIRWLHAHCQEYGFILRYPKDKSDITGVIYEPWHFRYVGLEAAGAVTESGLCLEEYHEYMAEAPTAY